MSIPKIIHYCWFGDNPMPDSAITCIESWKKMCPDYKIKIWNEDNYDISKCKFMKEAYEEKKYAFVADYARLDIIYNYGGIYLDTDVEVIKSFDFLLNYKGFASFDDDSLINTGLGFGAVEKCYFIKENLEAYHNLSFAEYLNKLNSITCPTITTKVMEKYGLILNGKTQIIDDFIFLSKDYMCPLNFYNGNLTISPNTISIHKFSMSWMSEKDVLWHEYNSKLNRILGKGYRLYLFMDVNLFLIFLV